MSVTLPHGMADMVRDKVISGEYASESEVPAYDRLQADPGRALTADAPRAGLRALRELCEGLAVFLHRSQARDDLRPELRTASYRKRVVISFSVEADTGRVTIQGVIDGGQDYES